LRGFSESRCANKLALTKLTASNKIEFSYLNGNLMVPKIHPLTLNFDCNSRKGGQRHFNYEAEMMALMTT